MTLPVSSIVNVSITRQTQFPTGPGFGTLLIVGQDGSSVISLAERIRSYSSIDGVAVDFPSNTEEYKAANAYFSQNPRPTTLKIGVLDETVGAGNFGDEMTAISAIDDDFYAVMVTAPSRISDNANISNEIAGWVEARTKMFLTATNEAAALTGGGQPEIFRLSGFDRSMVIYHADADSDVANSYPEAAFAGAMLTVDFDGTNTTRTGKFRLLRGITPSDLNQTQVDALKADNGNAYVTVGNTPMFIEGTMASGEFMDIIHGLDWQAAEIQTRVFGILATQDKVPYTKIGGEMLGAQTRLALAQGVTNGLLAPRFDEEGNLEDAIEVTVPSVFSASLSQRSERQYPPISFIARVAGAVHSATVNGTVSV